MAPEPTSDADAEVERLFALVRQRYGERLTPGELDEVRKGVEGVVRTSRALRAVKLENADEPFPPFTPYRARS
jgi:hypothetical protein